MNHSKASYAFYQTGKDEFTLFQNGDETLKVTKETMEILLTIARAKKVEHISLIEDDDPETNLQIMEAGVNYEDNRFSFKG